MPARKPAPTKWEFIYPPSDQTDTPRKTRRSQKKPIGCRHDEDEFYIGDCVLVDLGDEEPAVAILKGLDLDLKGQMQAVLAWFILPSAITKNQREDVIDGEIYCTADVSKNEIDRLHGRATVLSRNKFSDTTKTDATFMCRRGYEADLAEYSEEFDWDTIYQGRETDTDKYYDDILNLLPARKKRKRSQQPKPRATAKSKPAITFSDSGESGNEDWDDSDADVEEESDDEFGGDASDEEQPKRKRVAAVAAPRTPKKNTTPKTETPSKSKRTPQKTQTPKKAQTPKNRVSTTTPKKPAEPVAKMEPLNGRKIFIKKTPGKNPTTLPLRADMEVKHEETSLQKAARQNLHVASLPDSLPCRENEFSQLFLAIESAINSRTGTCLYVSGTPGTGKTATIREVVAQLQLRREVGELADFDYVEINGMKLANPHTAYELLWETISGELVSAASAKMLLEHEFKSPSPDRVPTVVLMDELDQLLTRNQGVMYNFFDWPTLVHSRLIVVAVANTMDLPERTLSNKVTSRLGLMRLQFPGYTYQQLVEIIGSRLGPARDIFESDAIEFAARKIAGVSGDARRALEICRRAVELANDDVVTLQHVKQAISESTASPLASFLQNMAIAGKVLVCAILARVRRSSLTECPLSDVLVETERLVTLTDKATHTQSILWANGRVRMAGFLNALSELVEAGVVVQQAMRGESTASVRLIVPEDVVKNALKDDHDVADII